MKNGIMFKRSGSVLAIVAVLGLMAATIAPRRADAIVGIAASAPVAIVTGVVIAGAAVATSGVSFLIHPWLGYPLSIYVCIPALAIGLIVLPADLAGQYRFPELEVAPTGISESEFADYLRDRATLEVLAQDVRAEVARDIVSEAQWKTMSESEQKSWTEGRLQVAGKLWAEYVNEGMISEGSLKTLAAVSQK